MILPFLLALLAFVTLLVILAPLLRSSRPGLDRASYDQAVYRDQLRELERDIARGLTTPDEASSSRLEIHRRLLATDRVATRVAPGSAAADLNAPATPSAVSPARRIRSPILAGAAFLLIAAGSLAVYLRLGAPDVPDEPFATREANLGATGNKQRLTLERAADDLAEKLKGNPSDPQGWLLYGRALATLNRWQQAEDAYRHAMALGDNSPDVVADHAEMLVLSAGGTVTPAAEAAFHRILAGDPGSGIARYYLAVSAIQAGRPRQAIDMLQALLADMPANSPLRDQIGQRIADAASAAHIAVPELAKGATPAPAGSEGDTNASADGLSDEQRGAMIQSMVARLAAKQQADPGNFEGWLQLGRAYTVLRQPDRAADAYEKAAALKPSDASIPLQEARTLLADHKPTDAVPPRVVDLLKRVEVAEPREPLVLWYLGIAAVQNSHPEEARRYWETLLATLPPAGDDARMIEAALDALPHKESPPESPVVVSPAPALEAPAAGPHSDSKGQ